MLIVSFLLRVVLSLALFFVLSASVAQENISVKRFKKLDRAVLQPDSVFSLDLSGKKLVEFPVEILEMTNLRELRLSKCKLKTIPDLTSLAQLQVLDLRSNKLDTIHPSIYGLTALEKLRLGNNKIRELAPELNQLSELRLLDLWGNMIIDLPSEIQELKQLIFLDLRVMEINSERQERISIELPECQIFFSVPCNCME